MAVEYFTGGGLCGEKPVAAAVGEWLGGVRAAGDSMLRALARDLGEIPGARVVTTRDRRLPAGLPGVETHAVNADERWEPRLRELLDQCDAFWPIAPETGGALADLCALCEQGGKRLLNSSAAAVRRVASKRRVARALERVGLPCVETWDASGAWFDRVAHDALVVCKPDDGVGCRGVRVAPAASMRGRVRDGSVVQPYVEGEAASLSILYGAGEHRLAAVNAQEIERRGGALSLKACIVNGLRNGSRDALRDFDALAGRIGRAIPGLAGYVGVDCIVRDGGTSIVEINPRLTTSYIGLRRSLGINPAACVVSLLSRSPTPRFDLESATAVRVAA